MRIKAWIEALGIAVCVLAQPAVAGPLEDGVAAYDRGDYATALQFLRPLAERGLAYAQFNLGVMYERGRGVPQDYAKAAKWFRLAAEQGEVIPQLNLAYMYLDGQ